MCCTLDVMDIVRKYIDDNGYDGLINPDDGCSCDKDKLFPCCEYFGGCIPGYSVEVTEENVDEINANIERPVEIGDHIMWLTKEG